MGILTHDIGPSEIEMRKDWMTTEILELMTEKKIQKTSFNLQRTGKSGENAEMLKNNGCPKSVKRSKYYKKNMTRLTCTKM